MKIAVVGCGAVGSYYGAMLARAGQAVHFLLRSDYEAVRCGGVRILSPRGDFRIQPGCARSAEEIGPSELVLIGLKTTANARFSTLLPPLVGTGTAVVTLQNGLGNEEQLARLFPADQILGGLCFVCLNRIEPGVIRHLDHGQVVLGEFQRRPEPRTEALAALFREAGVPCKITDNLARAHWEKLIWNIPFNGLGVAAAIGFEEFVAPCAARGARPEAIAVQARNLAALSTSRPQTPTSFPTDALLGDARWAGLVRELLLEVIRAANALGFAIPEALADTQIERTRTMGSYKASTLLDFERRQPLELENLFLEPCRRARRAGVAVPRLERLCEVLGVLDSRSNWH